MQVWEAPGTIMHTRSGASARHVASILAVAPSEVIRRIRDRVRSVERTATLRSDGVRRIWIGETGKSVEPGPDGRIVVTAEDGDTTEIVPGSTPNHLIFRAGGGCDCCPEDMTYEINPTFTGMDPACFSWGFDPDTCTLVLNVNYDCLCAYCSGGAVATLMPLLEQMADAMRSNGIAIELETGGDS